MTLKEAAEKTKLSVETLRYHIHKKRLKTSRIKNRFDITKDELQKFIDQRNKQRAFNSHPRRLRGDDGGAVKRVKGNTIIPDTRIRCETFNVVSMRFEVCLLRVQRLINVQEQFAVCCNCPDVQAYHKGQLSEKVAQRLEVIK